MTNHPFLQKLRAATSAAHETLENHPLSRELTRNRLSPHAYALYLSAMYGVMDNYEMEILPRLQYKSQYSPVSRKTAISSDLHQLNTAGIDLPPVLPFHLQADLTDLAITWGAAYVIEGSTLGGRVIIRQIEPLLRESGIGDAMTFFTGYGAETGPRWKAFLDALLAFADQPGNQERIIAGANSTFAAIFEHFDLNTARHVH
ncbi:biliverdin-producing heme oxygenase [Flavihumibacter petaseus]|uniref:Putative oxidoreductase n=1 Tax=Flavihumibacter petaseus NBRC 106054 TaxID=1220578 RepID=A0A0E9N6V3_9BACT|nr:biliverdin-producing heme oxygenase [Flavihumibacter petaseus]GAO45554.1 putative oxidoreductase [Flavihumibacter petaseus NBRC 106054]